MFQIVMTGFSQRNRNLNPTKTFPINYFLIAFYLFKQQWSLSATGKSKIDLIFCNADFFAEPLIDFCSTGSLGMVRLLLRDLSGRRVLHQQS